MATPVATQTGKRTLSERIGRIAESATLAVVAEAAKLREQGADLVDFGAGEPHFPTPAHIKQAGIDAIQNNFTKYTAPAGIKELRQAIVARHAQDLGSDYKFTETVAGTGGKNTLFNTMQVLVDRGDEVIVPVPYWVSFRDIIEYAGGKCVFIETDEKEDFRLTPQMVERALTPKTKVILLNSPNNPSGAVMPPEDQRAIADLARERGIYLVSDECYVYLNYTGQRYSLGAHRVAKDNLVIIGSMSKTYAMTGWRMGFALGPAEVIGAIAKLQSQETSSPNSIAQKASLAALTGPQECVDVMMKDYVRLRDICVDGLASIPGVTCTRPTGAFYAYPNVSAYFGRGGMKNASDVVYRLLHEAGIVCVPGDGFGTSQHIRLSYATSEAKIRKGLDRMRKFFSAIG
jgi:aspartate aminotransferase